MQSRGVFTQIIDKQNAGKRLDQAITFFLPDCSRTLLSYLIRKGNVLVNGKLTKPSYRVKPGEKISGSIPSPEPVSFKPEPVEINIIYEDNDILVVNKAAGMVVHPAPGHYSGTLVNALLYHCPGINQEGDNFRPGIVHRLDKDTSGLLVVAKNQRSHYNLSEQFKNRKIYKLYMALVSGEMESYSGTIDLPIGRHPVDRKKMSTISKKYRNAKTSWRVIEKFKEVSLIELNLETGRTHQIRVHCAAIGHPVIGDTVYNNKKGLKKNISYVSRQMLHSWKLRITHPSTKKIQTFQAPIPQDMEGTINRLRNTTSVLF